MLTSIWAFLTDETNRATLGLIGGFFASIIGGIWVFLKFLLKKNDSKAEHSPTVSATSGSIAIGRDIHNSTVTVGVDEKEIQRRIDEAQRPLIDQMKSLINQVSRDKGVPIEPLQTVLQRLGEFGVPDDEILRRLNVIADQVVKLRRMLGGSTNDRPEFSELRQQVLTLLDHGDLNEARVLLRRGQEDARRLHLVREQVETIATEGRVDQLEFDYRSAAAKYAEAALLVRAFDPDGVWGLLMEQADALRLQGTEYGDSDALKDAIALYRRCLTLAPRPKRPLDWAQTQNGLGIALSKLGEREATVDSLKEAVEAYQEALKECTRERAPLDWAATKNNIGNALVAIGEREEGTASIEEALGPYDEALEISTRERVPLDWANIQSNLGTALQIIGKRKLNGERLRQAISHFESALLERKRDQVPLDWALTQNNLGNTYSILAELEKSVDLLKASIACFLEALKERTKDRVPLDWAMTATNLGMVLARMGLVVGNVNMIRSGREAVIEALELFERLGAQRYATGNRKNLDIIEKMLTNADGHQS